MLSPLTAAKIDHGLAVLRAAQLLEAIGEADDGEEVPPPGEVSSNTLARFCGVSRRTMQLFERRAVDRFASELIGRGMPPHIAAAIIEHIDRAPQDIL